MQEVINNGIEDYMFFIETNPIEILGYAKNDIAEAKGKSKNLPHEYMEKLSDAYALLNEVQEYLYSN